MFKKTAPPSPPQLAVFREAVNHHLWQKKALDAFETHAFTGTVGQDRWCSRCTLKLDAGWKNPALPVPPSCGDPSIPFKVEWNGGAAYAAYVAKKSREHEDVAD